MRELEAEVSKLRQQLTAQGTKMSDADEMIIDQQRQINELQQEYDRATARAAQLQGNDSPIHRSEEQDQAAAQTIRRLQSDLDALRTQEEDGRAAHVMEKTARIDAERQTRVLEQRLQGADEIAVQQESALSHLRELLTEAEARAERDNTTCEEEQRKTRLLEIRLQELHAELQLLQEASVASDSATLASETAGASGLENITAEPERSILVSDNEVFLVEAERVAEAKLGALRSELETEHASGLRDAEGRQ
eukprot:SAG11_NODE_6883_length_1231_cov_5.506184_2_plen_250_part_01